MFPPSFDADLHNAESASVVRRQSIGRRLDSILALAQSRVKGRKIS